MMTMNNLALIITMQDMMPGRLKPLIIAHDIATMKKMSLLLTMKDMILTKLKPLIIIQVMITMGISPPAFNSLEPMQTNQKTIAV